MSKSLAVVIVSWNTRELLRNCLQSVLAEEVVAQVVVVDNASHDGSAAMIQHEFPEVFCIAESTKATILVCGICLPRHHPHMCVPSTLIR